MKELNPEALAAIENRAKDLLPSEIQKKKVEFMEETIETCGRSIKKYQKTVIIMGIVSVLFLPFFIISIPTYLNYLSTSNFKKQKIRWALNTWEKDLGSDYERLCERLRSF